MANTIIWKDRVDHLTVRCTRGAAWITWQGGGDVVLEPGQSVEVRKVRGFCLELLRQGEARLEERGREARVVAPLGEPAAARS